MRRGIVALSIMTLVVAAGIGPARSERPKLLKFDYCTGDGRLQIFDLGPVGDDIYINGDIGCLQAGSGYSHPMHVEAIIGASTVATAGDCGPNGTAGPLTNLRMRVKMTLSYAGKTYTAVRAWTGQSSGNFPGSNINGRVRDPIGVVALGSFRLEPFPSFYCAFDFSYIRLWDVVMGPAPGA